MLGVSDCGFLLERLGVINIGHSLKPMSVSSLVDEELEKKIFSIG